MATHSGAPFVGRELELEELGAALDDALCGRGRLVMLVGEPGIGKTRMAEEFATRATSRGAQVLWGRCHEEPGAPPFWPWLQIIRAYVRERDAETLRSEMGAGASDIAELVADVREKLPDLKPPPALENPDAARFRLFDSIASFLANASQRQPLLLILDNLHWADKPSLLLLEFVGRELGKTRVLVVGTYRDVDVSRKHPLLATLGELTRERLFHRVLLRGLNKGDVGRLVELTAGVKPPEGLVDAVNAQTEGNPFFVTEVVRLLAEEGKLTERVSQDAFPRRTRIPEGVREVVGQRLNRLSEQCNRVLTIASVIGREFTLAQLERLSEGQSSEQLLETLEETLSTHMVEESPGAPDEYRFTHALVQHTLRDELSTARRVRLHARIAEALEKLYGHDAPGHAAELAYHFAEAETVLGTERLVKYSLLAGESALAAYACEEAMAHFQRGLAAKEGEPMDMVTADLLFGLGRAQMALLTRQELQQAVLTLGRALDYYIKVGDRGRILAVGMVSFSECAGITTANELLARCLPFVPPDSHDAGRMLSHYARALAREKGDHQGAQQAFDRALTIARREHDEALEMRTLANSANIDMFLCRWNDAIAKGLRVAELAKHVDEPFYEVIGKGALFKAQAVVGESGNLTRDAAVLVAVAEKAHDREWLAIALGWQGLAAACFGDWEIGRGLQERSLAMSPRDPRSLCYAAWIEHQTGRFTQGEGYLTRLEQAAIADLSGISLETVCACLGIPLTTRITRNSDPRLEQAERWAVRLVSSQVVSPFEQLYARIGLAYIAVIRGDRTQAQEQYGYLERHAGTSPQFFSPVVAIDPLLGLLAHTIGQLDRAAVHFGDGLAFCRKAGYRPELAWTCHDYAELLLARNAPGDRQKAAALVEEGLALATDLGMKPLVGRLEVLQQKVASRRGRPDYPDGLSEREVEVLRLVAQGKTNQQIAETLVISLHTVERHVSNIFDKTSAANRAEAVAYAMRHSLAA